MIESFHFIPNQVCSLNSAELSYETQDEYDKAYFAAQWVNPQCKWLPGQFRHEASFWGDLSNFFSSLFF